MWFVSMSHPPALWCIGHIGPSQQSGIFAARLAAGPAARVASKTDTASSEMSLFVIEKGSRPLLPNAPPESTRCPRYADARKNRARLLCCKSERRLDTDMHSRYIN